MDKSLTYRGLVEVGRFTSLSMACHPLSYRDGDREVQLLHPGASSACTHACTRSLDQSIIARSLWSPAWYTAPHAGGHSHLLWRVPYVRAALNKEHRQPCGFCRLVVRPHSAHHGIVWRVSVRAYVLCVGALPLACCCTVCVLFTTHRLRRPDTKGFFHISPSAMSLGCVSFAP